MNREGGRADGKIMGLRVRESEGGRERSVRTREGR